MVIRFISLFLVLILKHNDSIVLKGWLLAKLMFNSHLEAMAIPPSTLSCLEMDRDL